MKLFIKYKAVLFIFFISIFSVVNLFQAGLPPTHDGEYHVVRFYEFDKTLRDGNWYPLWAQDLNYLYGSPLFNYVYPLPNYFASLFHSFQFSFIDAFKLNLIFATIVGAFTSYFYSKRRFGEWGGVLTSVFYTYAPYHFLDIYVRGSVGEVWALAFFPLPLIFVDNLARKRTVISIVLLAISYSLVIFSHNILAAMYTIFILFYVLFVVSLSNRKKNSLFSIGIGLCSGILLSAIFTFPALLEQRYVEGLKIFNVFEHFPDLYQLLIPSWGSGFSGGGLANQMSFQVGFANLLGIVLVVYGLIRGRIKKEKKYIIFFLICFVAVFYLITPYSQIVWRSLGFMEYFQFPWRFLSLIILFCAVLAGSITKIYASRILYIVLIALAIATTYSYARAPYFLDRKDYYYITNPSFIHGTNSIGNVFQTIWFPLQTKTPTKRAILIKGKGDIRVVSQTTTSQKYQVNLSSPATVQFNTAFFPGWRAYSNEQETEVKNIDGRIGIDLKPGKNAVYLVLTDTTVRVVGKGVTILTIVVVFGILLRLAVIQLMYDRRNR